MNNFSFNLWWKNFLHISTKNYKDIVKKMKRNIINYSKNYRNCNFYILFDRILYFIANFRNFNFQEKVKLPKIQIFQKMKLSEISHQ